MGLASNLAVFKASLKEAIPKVEPMPRYQFLGADHMRTLGPIIGHPSPKMIKHVSNGPARPTNHN